MVGVMIAIFVLGVAISVNGAWSRRIVDIRGQEKLRVQAADLAESGLSKVDVILKTNKRRYADPGCWKTIETADACDPLNSPMMAVVGSGAEEYSIHSDYIDFTPALIPPAISGEFDDSTILAREANSFSVHRKYLGPDNTKPILTSNVPDSENTYFYHRIEVTAREYDFDGDGVMEEQLNVTSSVKWPYRNRVKTYSTSRSFMHYN